jgi:hypothetical protein
VLSAKQSEVLKTKQFLKKFLNFNFFFRNLLCLSMLLPTMVLQIPVAVEGLVAGGAILLPPHRLLHQQSFLSHHRHENFSLLTTTKKSS